jgi:hypothetical protein
MAYKLRCDYCKCTFTAHSRSAQCPKNHGRYQSTTFIEDVLETAVDVATAYFMVDVAADVIGGVGDMIGSMFD